MKLSEEGRRKIINALDENPDDWNATQNREFFGQIESAARTYLRTKPSEKLKKGYRRPQSLDQIRSYVTTLELLFNELDPLSQRIIRQNVGEQLEADKGNRTKQGKRYIDRFFLFTPEAITHTRDKLVKTGAPDRMRVFISNLAKILRSSKDIRFSTVKTTSRDDSGRQSRFNNRPVLFCLAVFEAIGDVQTLNSLRPTMKRVVTALRSEAESDYEEDDIGASVSDD